MFKLRFTERSSRSRCAGAVILLVACGLAGSQDDRTSVRSAEAPLTMQSQQNAPAPNAEKAEPTELAVRLVALTRDWLETKLSAPGTSIAAHEIEREKRGSGVWVHYHVFVKGAGRDQTYQYLEWPINSKAPFVRMRGLSIANDGLVICAGRTPEQCRGEKQDDDVDFVFHPVKGEPYRLTLVSADQKTKVFFGVVPDPIINNDSGCTLEVIRILPKFEVAMLRASGYKPNENLWFANKSYDEDHSRSVKSDGDGKYVSALLPFVTGKDAGKTELTLKGANCAPKLSFDWGK